MADLSEAELRGIIQLFSEFKEPLDYLIVDVAAGISPTVLSFLKSLPSNPSGGSRRAEFDCRCLRNRQGAGERAKTYQHWTDTERSA